MPYYGIIEVRYIYIVHDCDDDCDDDDVDCDDDDDDDDEDDDAVDHDDNNNNDGDRVNNDNWLWLFLFAAAAVDSYHKDSDDNVIISIRLLYLFNILLLALQHRATETPSTPRKLVRTSVVNNEILVENYSIITSSTASKSIDAIVTADTKSDGDVFVSTHSEL